MLLKAHLHLSLYQGQAESLKLQLCLWKHLFVHDQAQSSQQLICERLQCYKNLFSSLNISIHYLCTKHLDNQVNTFSFYLYGFAEMTSCT